MDASCSDGSARKLEETNHIVNESRSQAAPNYFTRSKGSSNNAVNSVAQMGENDDPVRWIQMQIDAGRNPHSLLSCLLPGVSVNSMNEKDLYQILFELFVEYNGPRCKIVEYNSLHDAALLIHRSSKIIVLTGAGVSVSCGIPDFRSKDGIYAKLKKDCYDIPNPQAMFDINFFRTDPRPFFKFAKEIYPGKFTPSPSHMFIKHLEMQGKLLRNYTQNIDTLEQVAGIERVIHCHGSFMTASCTNCNYTVSCDHIRDAVFKEEVPYCPNCPPDSSTRGILKPNIIFFGENLHESYHKAIAMDRSICDLLIVIGSSMRVKPVALIPNMLPHKIPQILINREPLKHLNFDIELLGDCDIIISELCFRLRAHYPDLATIFPGSQPLKQIRHIEIPQSCFERRAGSDAEERQLSINSVRNGVPVVQFIPDNSFLFISPNRYVFHGAEISLNESDMESDSSEHSDGEEITERTLRDKTTK